MRRTEIAETGAAYIICMVMEMPDRTIYIADRPAYVDNGSASPLQFAAGLSNLAELKLTQASGPMVSSLSLSWSSEEINVAQLYSERRYPDAAVIEISVLREGSDWSDRTVVLADARIQSFTYGRGSTAVDMTIGRTLVEISKDIGDDAFPISSIVQQDGSESHDFGSLTGQMFPIILGRVFHTPAYRLLFDGVTIDQLLIAGHHVEQQSIEIQNGNSLSTLPVNPAFYTVAVNNTSRPDLAGGSGNVKYAAIDGIVGSWDVAYVGDLTASFPAGGKKNARGEVILGAGMVLEYLLETYMEGVDWDRMRPTLDKLGGWEIGLSVDTQASAIEVIRNRLVTELPITEQRSGTGIWYSYEASLASEPVRAALVDGVHISIAGDVVTKQSIINSITVNYGYHSSREEYMHAVTIDKETSGLCFYSQSIFGDRVGEVVEASTIWDAGTATSLAKHLAEKDALPKRRFQAIVDESHYWLDAGDIVTVTSADLYLDEVRCRIVERALQLPGIFEFETIERLPSPSL